MKEELVYGEEELENAKEAGHQVPGINMMQNFFDNEGLQLELRCCNCTPSDVPCEETGQPQSREVWGRFSEDRKDHQHLQTNSIKHKWKDDVYNILSAE